MFHKFTLKVLGKLMLLVIFCASQVAATLNNSANDIVKNPYGNFRRLDRVQYSLATSVDTWAPTSLMTIPRFEHTATLLSNGKVLVVGGGSLFSFSASAELYDPSSGLGTATDSMASVRGAHTATLLSKGKVLVTGGINGPDTLASAELYDPTTGLLTATGSMTIAREYHTATLLPIGKVIVLRST